jgi:lipocalin
VYSVPDYLDKKLAITKLEANLKLNIQKIYFLSSSGKLQSSAGVAKIVKPGQLSVSFNQFTDFLNPILSPQGNYWILDTDYNTYALVYSCQRIFGVKLQVSWYLSRSQTLNQATIAKLDQTLKSFDPVLQSQIKISDQSCRN